MIEQLENEHLVGQTTEPHFTGIMHTVYYYDFIAHDFFWKIIPQPEMFELKQAVAIAVPRHKEKAGSIKVWLIFFLISLAIATILIAATLKWSAPTAM